MSPKNARRASFSRLSGAEGVTPAASCFARTKRSTGERVHAAFFTAGGAPAASGANDRNPRSCATLISRFAFPFGPERGSGRPISTHFVRSAITSSASLCFGGICVSGSLQRTAFTSRLSSGLPGTTAGPVSPPASTPSRVSRKNPPFSLPSACASAEWHL